MSGERELLQRLIDGPVSGDVLARDAGLTRAAMWKRIQVLREGGVQIDATPGRGYALARTVELLDADAILAQLPRAHGVHELQVRWSIDSTNSELLRRTTPPRGASVLLAEHQSAGRGRRGRSWASPLAAHLYLSVARHFSGGLARLGGLSLVAGVAVAEALHALGFYAARLKWPNDLVVDDRKLGGLLVEGGGEHGGPVRAVIGLGLNVRMPDAFAARIDQPWIDLQGLGAVPSRNVVAARVLQSLLPALDAFDADGLAPFLPRYAALDALAGRRLEIRNGEESFAADHAGIADDGALCVRVGDTLRRVHAGEVSVRPR
jgi:BirA family biotin operon repressor/biotin-[acetyl-CoA-carboxylase] ligase